MFNRTVRAVWPVGLLGLILLLAFFLRLYWVFHHSAVLQGEEGEYTRLAENLARGHGYVGMFEGPQLMYPPLFAVLIAAASSITSSVAAAGRFVSVAGGLVLVLAVFLIARSMYGSRVALIAAMLSACHPLLIFLSGVTYSESVYLPLMILGIYWGLTCIDGERSASSILCGTCFGLAYLTRPEALVYPFVVIAGILLSARARGSSLRKQLRPVFLILIPFMILVTPYVAYLSVHTGGLRLEGKSIMNYAIGQRVNAGMDPLQASFGIGPDLKEEGPFLSPNVFVAESSYPASFRTFAEYWMTSAWRNRKAMPEWLVVYPAFGSLAMIGLVTVALIYRPWGYRRLIMEGILLTIAVGYLFILFGLPFIELRFLLPLLPILIIWMSKGIDEVADWTMSSVRQMTAWRAPTVTLLGGGVRSLLALSLVLLAIRGTSAAPRNDPRELALRQAGIWLGAHAYDGRRIMTVSAEVAYYSGGVFLPLPYADGRLALDYLREKNPDFVVLTHEQARRGPYLEDWFEHGIAGAPLVYKGGRGGDEVLIYEWKNRCQEEAGEESR